MTAKIFELFPPDKPQATPSYTHLPSAGAVGRMLRRGLRIPDALFDRFLTHDLRVVSPVYWTPLSVVLRAVEWLDSLSVRTVVDIGSGAGKFCVAAALAGGSRFVGVEQRSNLVDEARTLARTFGVEDRVAWIHGRFRARRTPSAEAYYLYNPFGENLYGEAGQLDDQVELSFDRHANDVEEVEALLQRAQLGTYLLTYNGFGGRVPGGFQEVRVDRELPNVLRMWRKNCI